MKSLITSEPDSSGFGSTFGPVVNGVASGLARLFPPIENGRPPESDDPDAEGRDESETGESRA